MQLTLTFQLSLYPMSEINKRNTESFAEAIKVLQQTCYRQAEILIQQNAAIASLQERMGNLEQQLTIQKVQLTGLGPSVRG